MRLLPLVLAALLLPLSALADYYTETVDGIEWTYTVVYGKAAVGGGNSDATAVPTSTSGAITIPSTLGGYPVTSISDYAFLGCSYLTMVTIPDSVIAIGRNAFEYCIGLTSVMIGKGVTRIGNYAFHGCNGLTSLTIPDSVMNIENGAFFHCSRLNAVTIPDSVTSISPSMFANCYRLDSVTIPTNVTSIGSYAFENCTSLTSVTVPDSVTEIGPDAFRNCNAALYDTHSIPGVTLVDGWVIGTNGVPALSGSLDLSGIRGIGYEAFYGCDSLTSVTIPGKVTSMGSRSFFGCTGLTSVALSHGVQSIAGGAFAWCNGLASVMIPNSVTSIGDYAFFGCSGLVSFSIPDSVTSIGEDAFTNTPFFVSWCRNLVNNASGSSGADSSDPRYSLSTTPGDRAIASITVDSDTEIGAFVLKDGKVYDSVLYVDNPTAQDVNLKLPAGNTYKAFKGAAPLTIPAQSQNILTITRIAGNGSSPDVFLVSREELESVQ